MLLQLLLRGTASRVVPEPAILLTPRNLPLPPCSVRAFVSTYPRIDQPLPYSTFRRGRLPCTSRFVGIFEKSDKTFIRSFHVSSIALASAPSHYDVLGVPTTATHNEIKDAFYQLSKQLHPDRNPNSPDAAEKFKSASTAYAVIGNPENRKKYDAELKPKSRRRPDRDFGDPENGPGFSSVNGDQWRRKYDSDSGYRKTGHDERFDRRMRVATQLDKADDDWLSRNQVAYSFLVAERKRREQQWADYYRSKAKPVLK